MEQIVLLEMDTRYSPILIAMIFEDLIKNFLTHQELDDISHESGH